MSSVSYYSVWSRPVAVYFEGWETVTSICYLCSDEAESDLGSNLSKTPRQTVTSSRLRDATSSLLTESFSLLSTLVCVGNNGLQHLLQSGMTAWKDYLVEEYGLVSYPKSN